ncbi:hypothetical protein U8527_09375 [Kordia algicida OT-1]|uniref:Gliding motility protein GldL-like N-terminal domain-containing protein n=1 Tax=Kordia algicida OT-1 TaxID=391587 RepID=A9DUN4_9FLAO|nr:hypothetical protein [Kordia algicida]EDP96312.1 hypothetical protein KAOT1_02847 [Kordia algicida OT-1]
MKLTDAHIEFISNSLEFHGLQSESIKEDILDHICTTIEASQHTNFEQAYEEAIQKLGGYYNIKQLQTETKQLLHAKTMLKTKKGLFVSSLAMTVVFSVGLIFKMFHWPYANMMLLVGFSVLILIYFPLFFYAKYQRSIIK